MLSDINSLSHLCFDKDGVLFDVHKYWTHTAKLRIDYLSKHFSLGPAEENIVISEMGIDINSDKIRKGGPLGYKPRNVIINTIISTLSKFDIDSSPDQIGKIFSKVDYHQQQNNDLVFE